MISLTSLQLLWNNECWEDIYNSWRPEIEGQLPMGHHPESHPRRFQRDRGKEAEGKQPSTRRLVLEFLRNIQ